MRVQFVSILASMVAFGAAAQTTAQSRPPYRPAYVDPKEYLEPTCPPVARGAQRSHWRTGVLTARQCQLDMLRTGLAARNLDFLTVHGRAQEIRYYYQARSGRQQAWLDANAGVTVFGTAGYLASQGAPTLTQHYWGALALAPIVFTQANAYEPTRNLFYGAGFGVDFIAARYDRIDWALRSLARHTATGGPLQRAESRCKDLKRLTDEVKDNWQNGDDKNVLLPELSALQKACGDLQVQSDELHLLAHAGRTYATQGQVDRANPPACGDGCNVLLPYLFARDVLAFDDIVAHTDHDLRYTAYESLTSIAAAPFLTASSLLTGDDTKKAIEGLKTQAAFSNLDLRLSPVPLPPTPSITGGDQPRVVVSAAATDRLKATTRPAGAPTAERVKAVVEAGVAIAQAVNEGRYEVKAAGSWVTALRDAAAADRLSFAYDATKASVTVALSQPAASPATLLQVGK